MGVEGIYNKIQAVSSAFTRKQMMETLGKLVAGELLTEKGMVYSFPVQLLRKWTAAWPGALVVRVFHGLRVRKKDEHFTSAGKGDNNAESKKMPRMQGNNKTGTFGTQL